MSPELMAAAGVVAALVVAFVLWKIVKTALKLALFVAVCLALAAVVGGWLKSGARVALPVPAAPR